MRRLHDRRTGLLLRDDPAFCVYEYPDCDFAIFSNRPVNSVEIATGKLRAISNAVGELRRQLMK